MLDQTTRNSENGPDLLQKVSYIRRHRQGKTFKVQFGWTGTRMLLSNR